MKLEELKNQKLQLFIGDRWHLVQSILISIRAALQNSILIETGFLTVN